MPLSYPRHVRVKIKFADVMFRMVNLGLGLLCVYFVVDDWVWWYHPERGATVELGKSSEESYFVYAANDQPSPNHSITWRADMRGGMNQGFERDSSRWETFGIGKILFPPIFNPDPFLPHWDWSLPFPNFSIPISTLIHMVSSSVGIFL